MVSFGIGILALGIYFWPQVTSVLAPTAQEVAASKTILDTVSNITNIRTANPAVPLTYQPRVDPSLPVQSKLKIPSIGVNATLQEATYDNYESALKKGPWRVSDFGTPADREQPTIIAAHRFGYLAWSNLFRRKSSFYNLPKLAVGDTVEIDWGQRKYLYEIYSEDKGGNITDYYADLILYTCEDLMSEVRIFKYGKLLAI
jgi:sortase (surface protein transpeptidase)